MKYTIEVSPKNIQRYKDLEIAYKSIIDLYIQQQDDLKALEKEEECRWEKEGDRMYHWFFLIFFHGLFLIA